MQSTTLSLQRAPSSPCDSWKFTPKVYTNFLFDPHLVFSTFRNIRLDAPDDSLYFLNRLALTLSYSSAHSFPMRAMISATSHNSNLSKRCAHMFLPNVSFLHARSSRTRKRHLSPHTAKDWIKSVLLRLLSGATALDVSVF